MFSITLSIFRKVKNTSYVSDCLFYFTKYTKASLRQFFTLKNVSLFQKKNLSLKIFYFTFNLKASSKI
jgi:hypothetical protein